MNDTYKTILVVDDFKNITDVVKTTLEIKGYKALTATSGEQAMGILTDPTYKVDLIISDYNMPNMTGLEFLKEVRTTVGCSLIPFMMLTTEKDPEKMKEAKKAGLNAWVKKPYKLQSFLEQISYLISKNERARI